MVIFTPAPFPFSFGTAGSLEDIQISQSQTERFSDHRPTVSGLGPGAKGDSITLQAGWYTYPPLIKHGNGKFTIYRWFSYWNLHLHGISHGHVWLPEGKHGDDRVTVSWPTWKTWWPGLFLYVGAFFSHMKDHGRRLGDGMLMALLYPN